MTLDVPVMINCRDRVTDLRRLVHWLEAAGHTRIVLIDNQSTYEPLLDYYRSIPHRVLRLGKNYGKLALWKAGLAPESEYFVYTDPDVIPIDECPLDAVAMLHDTLRRHPTRAKAALGLHLDDVPDSLPSLEWERELVCDRRQLEPARNGTPAVYNSMSDTTFALYRPGAEFDLNALRTGHPYQCRHTSWYRTEPTDEELYYLDRAARGPLASSWADWYFNQGPRG